MKLAKVWGNFGGKVKREDVGDWMEKFYGSCDWLNRFGSNFW